ncbi:hypothetical protein CDAR_430481 [Caerostris darwini]|uniref:Uncharacterized protein n=1 Tax=Caerostris darwini TaxID=1538125 RepID=A0AAV4SM59_9ARAC|nr:hypothetical protein CDAR_430481 [Caerostris darwini]
MCVPCTTANPASLHPNILLAAWVKKDVLRELCVSHCTRPLGMIREVFHTLKEIPFRECFTSFEEQGIIIQQDFNWMRKGMRNDMHFIYQHIFRSFS